MSSIRHCLLTLALLLCLAAPGGAATFSVKRGINLDMWTTWPPEQSWGDPAVVLPYPEWRRHLKDGDFEALKDAGFDFVRIPVDPAPLLSGRTEAFRERMFASVLESARLVNRAGLKAVVDLHLVQSGGNHAFGMDEVMADPALFDRYLGIVRKMARTLAQEDPAWVAFEPMNEPVVDCEGAPDLWPERLGRLYAAARSSATRLTLVLTGACYSSAEKLAEVDPGAIPDDNVIWTFHSYTPFLLTAQGATWAGDFIRYVTGLPYPPHSVPREELDEALEAVRQTIREQAPLLRRRGMLAYLDEQIALMDTEEELDALMDEPFRTVEAWAEKHGIAPEDILLGEFGMIRQEYGNPYVVPAASRAAYVASMIRRAEDRGYGWSVWSYGGAFGVVEEFEGRRAEPDIMDAIRDLPPLSN